MSGRVAKLLLAVAQGAEKERISAGERDARLEDILAALAAEVDALSTRVERLASLVKEFT
jgi:hypothetical protein